MKEVELNCREVVEWLARRRGDLGLVCHSFLVFLFNLWAMLLYTVEPLYNGHLRAEESGSCREVETRVNVWTVHQKMTGVER